MSTVDDTLGNGVSMALDENDDPMFAYIAVKSSVDTGVAPVACDPMNAPQGCDAVYFTRWDPCAGAFTKPLVIETTLNYRGGNPGTQFLQVAYDLTTKEVGVAYYKTEPTDPNWADTYGAIFLATMKPGATSFSVQQVSDNLRTGNTDVTSSDSPVLAMGNGRIYIAFTTGALGPPPCPDNQTCLRFLSSTTATDPDAGNPPDSGTVVHFFDYGLVPLANTFSPYASPRANAIAIALDAMGRPGIAFHELPGFGGNASYNSAVSYWRSDMANAVAVTDTANVQNDLVSIGLAFEGNSPRVAGLWTQGQIDAGGAGVDYALTYASSSDQGTTWNPFIPIATSGGAGFYSTFAAAGGNEAIISHYNGSPSPYAQGQGCGSEPFVTHSTNNGATFTGCTLTTQSVNTNGNLSSAYGASRLTGKLLIAGNAGAELVDGGAGSGVVYYQSP
jgi:hypothetical protein